jgi:hypothetical protein
MEEEILEHDAETATADAARARTGDDRAPSLEEEHESAVETGGRSDEAGQAGDDAFDESDSLLRPRRGRQQDAPPIWLRALRSQHTLLRANMAFMSRLYESRHEASAVRAFRGFVCVQLVTEVPLGSLQRGSASGSTSACSSSLPS